MLRFLRKRRRPLIELRNFRKYLLYAVGEILLVMIGILLALQVNNWNENRKLNLERAQLYQSLAEEFRLVKAIYSKKKREFELTKRTTLEILNNTGKRPDIFEIREFDSLLYFATQIVTFHPSFVVYREIMGADKIDLIEDQKIKEQLYLFQSTYEDFSVMEGVILRDLSEELIPYLNEKVAFKNMEKFGTPEVSASYILKDSRKVTMELKFENLLNNYHYILRNQYQYFEKLGEVMDRLLVELERKNKLD